MIMAPELPSRPKPNPDDEQSTIIEPTDRVKSAHDKLDPRFEVARQKAEREAKVYEQRAERATEDPARAEHESDESDGDDDKEPEEAVEAPAAKGTFSFNMTAGDAEEDG
jgi:type IV secretory pathway VirB10-like protein